MQKRKGRKTEREGKEENRKRDLKRQGRDVKKSKGWKREEKFLIIKKKRKK